MMWLSWHQVKSTRGRLAIYSACRVGGLVSSRSPAPALPATISARELREVADMRAVTDLATWGHRVCQNR